MQGEEAAAEHYPSQEAAPDLAATTTTTTPTLAVATRQHRQQQRFQQIPISLGKASLRIRLEAYYSLIAPETLANRTEWLRKYDQIYEKYGGTHAREQKLASKLAKKYGTAVHLLLAKSVEDDVNVRRTGAAVQSNNNNNPTHGEEWYQLRENEVGSGDIHALSSNFDPHTTLMMAPTHAVYAANPWMGDSAMILDNVEKFATLLPFCDPLRRDPQDMTRKRGANRTETAKDTKHNHQKGHTKSVHPFEAIAQHLDSGPISVLHKLQKKRIKIVIRYVNAIRGTLTGILMAYDKHMNMLLRDVEEVYSPRPVDADNEMTNLELELERRNKIDECSVDSGDNEGDDIADGDAGRSESVRSRNWRLKKRQMKQLLVRGDMVVSIYDASEEKKIEKSRYYRLSQKKKAATTKMETKEGKAE